MAKSEPQEDFIDVEDDSSSEDCVTDDSDEDPTFDIVERTRSSLSKLSLKKSNPRSSKIKDSVRKRKLDFEEVKTPELDEVDEKSFEKVEKMIQDGQLEKLKVDQCKVYLRKHGLRLTGNKDVLIERIREHLGIINGGGELKYPVSSFVLNCKGDACTGDVVMFEQTVYEMYNIASRSASGPPCGTRVVAGRIVKESYGAAKQQHTFTIEVLWSKGEKPLPPLHPLLIKGRNLYRLNTMRQKWTDEAERSRVLLEKHSRGSRARSSRETRIQEKERRKTHKEQRDIRNTNSTHDMIHKENQHPNPNPVKVNYAQPQIVQTQRPQKPVQSTIQPNRILTEINQQSNYKTLPDQIKPQVNYIPEQNASIPGNPNKCLNLNVNQNQMKPLPSQMKPLPNQIKPTVNIISVQKTSLTDNVSRKWWGNITEVDKQTNAATNQQSYVQSHPSLKFPTQSLPHQLSNQPSHVQQYPNGYHRHPLTTQNLPPKSPMRQQHCKYYHQGRCHFGERCKFLHENRKDQSLNIPPQRPVHQLHNPSHVESYPYVNSRLYPLLHARREQR